MGKGAPGGGGEVRVNDPGQNSSLTLLIQLDVRDVMTTTRTALYNVAAPPQRSVAVSC